MGRAVRLRLLTWNVLRGCQGAGGRLEAMMESVAAARPDVVALQECHGWDERGSRILHRVARRLAMTPILTEARSGAHLVLLSRFPARLESRDSDDGTFRHGYQHVILAPAPGVDWHFVNTHLDPRSEEVRLAEALAIARAMRPHRDDLCSMTGDMNSLCPGDDVDGVRVRRRFTLDLARHPFLRGKFQYSGLSGATALAPRGAEPPPFHEKRLMRRVEMRGDVQAFLRKEGWVDAFRTLAPDEPGHTGPSDAPLFRIDYALLSRPLARGLVSCRVLRSARIVRASDHLPLLWQVDLSGMLAG